MMVERLIFRILTLSVMDTLVLSAAVEQSGDVRAAFKRAGGNRIELEAALHAVPGKDTDYVIAHASQYDLVNLTAQQIIENITYARKVHQALPYLGKKLDDELWREWVLPYRVLDEDLDLWRKNCCEKISPLLAKTSTTEEAAETVLMWVWSDHANDSKINLQSTTAENRNRSVSQLMASKESACREFNLFYVAALRSVGIPARHCMASRWYQRDSFHFYTEYWDCQLKLWVAVDTTDDMLLKAEPPAARVARGRWNALAYPAHPGYAPESDVYGKNLWEACVPTTADIASMIPVTLSIPMIRDGATVSAYIWNSGTWRLIQTSKSITEDHGELSCAMEFGKCASMDRPVLFTATDGESLKWAISTISGKTNTVYLRDVEESGGLQWRPEAVAGVAVKSESEQEGVNRE